MKRKNRKNQQEFVPATITTRYKHEEAERLIAQTVATINAEVVEEAIEMAESERPSIQEEGLGLYTENITRKHQVLLEQVNSLVGAESAKSEGVAFKKECERETEELEQKIHDIQHELRAENKKLANHNSKHGSDLNRWKKVLIGIGIIGLAEWLMNAGAFYPLVGGVWLSAMLAALGVTAAIFLVTHAIDAFVKNVKSIPGKVGIVLLCSTMVYVLLNALSNVRWNYLTNSGESEIGDQMDKMDFLAINFIMFLICLALLIAFRPGKGVKEEHKAFLKQQQKVDDLERSLTEAKERLSKLPKLRDEKLSSLYAILVMAKNYEQLIESEHQQSLTLWIKTNLKKRKPDKDGRTPIMFTEERPTLTTYFHNI